MTDYLVTDLNTMKEVQPGDTVTDFRGETAEFLSVTRGVEYNGTAKVSTRRKGFPARESYATVFNLRVETVSNDEPVKDPLLDVLADVERGAGTGTDNR